MAAGRALTVVRGNEGVSLQYTKDHLVGLASADDFLATLGGDPSDAIIMTPDGSHLTPEKLEQFLSSLLARSQELGSSSPLDPEDEPLSRSDVLFAFDRSYLAATADEAYATLQVRIEDVLEPHDLVSPDEAPDDDTVTALVDSFHRTSRTHFETSLNLLSHIRCLKLALTVALRNLDKSAEAQTGALDTFATFARGSVTEYGALLDAYEPSLALTRRIRLHPAMLSPSTNGSSVSNSSRTKCMGDFVFESRMKQIREGCLKVYAQLRTKFDSVQGAADEITKGIERIHEGLTGPAGDLDDLVELEHDVREGWERVEDIVAAFAGPGPVDERDSYLRELHVLAEDESERIGFLVDRKNYWIHLLVTSLIEVSSMQAMLPTISSDVAALNESLQQKTSSFKYLVRLRELVIAYAATVVEIVRRREFARHLLDHSAAIGGVLSKLSDDERQRRKSYRSDHSGKMPFEVRGMDDAVVPIVELEMRSPVSVPRPRDPGKSPSTVEDMPVLTRADINDLLANLREIEEDETNDPTSSASLAKGPAQAVRLFVEAKVAKLEAMESAFASAAERTTMTASQLLAQSVTSRDDGPLRAEAEHLRMTVDTLQSEVATLRGQLEAEVSDHARLRAASSGDGDAIKALQVQLDDLVAHAEKDRANADDRERQLQERLDGQTTELAVVTSKAASLEHELRGKARSLGDMERQLTSARATADDAMRDLQELQARHATHVSDRSTLEWSLERARERIDQFTTEVSGLVSENQRLSERAANKERQLRDHISEAECDRAVLENEVSRLKDSVARLEGEVSAANAAHAAVRSSIDASEGVHRQAVEKATADLQGQLRRLETDSSASIASLGGKSRSALKVAMQLKAANERIIARLAAMPAPGSSSRIEAPLPPIEEQPDLPLASSIAFDTLLASLQATDPDAYAIAVQKKADGLSQLVRKWMKESKGYRERAKLAQEAARLKITFRDFGVGDLALFLPTRNSTAQIWAAFNVSFPHYFLQPSERVSDLTRSREWLVARITSLKSFTVESKDATANPYALPVGTRYYLLEVDGPYVPDASKTARRESKEVNGTPSPKRKSDLGMSTRSPEPRRASSDFSVVEPVPIPRANQVDVATSPAPFSPGDSPFLSVSAQSRRTDSRPSGVSISLARSRLGPDAAPMLRDDPVPGPSNAPDLVLSESARPAFLPTASIVSSRTGKAPSIPPPARRPIPRARISRPASRASSSTSVRPSIAALLSSSPSNKGSSVAVENLSGSLLWKSRTPSGASDLLRRFSESK